MQKRITGDTDAVADTDGVDAAALDEAVGGVAANAEEGSDFFNGQKGGERIVISGIHSVLLNSLNCTRHPGSNPRRRSRPRQGRHHRHLPNQDHLLRRLKPSACHRTGSPGTERRPD